MARQSEIQAAEERLSAGGEPVLKAKFNEAVEIKISVGGTNTISNHTSLSLIHPKYKGHIEMVLVPHGIRIRSIGREAEVLTVPWSNISCYTTLSDVTWSQDRWENEKAAAPAA
jgi:hypothetical protein